MLNKCASKLKKGVFLIASPSIDYGIFYRSVVLLYDHSSIGSFGVIINKPIHIDPQERPFLCEDCVTQISIRAGGPNQPNQILLIQNQPCKQGINIEICKNVYLNETLEGIEDEKEPLQTLACFGCGGWAIGVLERELLNGIWFICSASKKHVFDTPPNLLWRTLLKEMGGKYKTLSLIPENLDLN